MCGHWAKFSASWISSNSLKSAYGFANCPECDDEQVRKPWRHLVPRYQKEMLRYLARQEGTSIGTVLSRELEGMASARAEELAAVPSVAVAMQFAGG
jgi:hypothetical protein